MSLDPVDGAIMGESLIEKVLLGVFKCLLCIFTYTVQNFSISLTGSWLEVNVC